MILTPHSHPRRRIYYQSNQMTIFQSSKGREERKEKNNNNDCVQNWSPTSVRKDEQSSRNKKLGPSTR
jgi:hypothetical protein